MRVLAPLLFLTGSYEVADCFANPERERRADVMRKSPSLTLRVRPLRKSNLAIVFSDTRAGFQSLSKPGDAVAGSALGTAPSVFVGLASGVNESTGWISQPRRIVCLTGGAERVAKNRD